MTSAHVRSPRRGRFVRDDPGAKRYPLALIEQAVEILCRLDAHLYLTNDQIEALLFQQGMTGTGRPRSPRGAAYAANTALRRLFDAGYLDRVPLFLPGVAPDTVKPHFVNVLSTRGARVAARVLTQRGGSPRWRRNLLPRPWHPIAHGFWIREVAISGECACRPNGWRWWSWFDDRQLLLLKRRHGARYRTVPDGFAMITNPTTGKHLPHFVEVDLGTESVTATTATRRDWRGKVDSYRHYLAHDFRGQFGVTTLPVILTVTESERRLEHLLAATAAAGGGGRFWFTTLDRLLPTGNVVERAARFWGPIWRVPHESARRSLVDRCAV
jgi:hypothetical protein